MNKTLLEKAKEAKTGNRNNLVNITSEHIELAYAWALGRLSTTQVSVALGLKSSSTLYALASFLREGVKREKIIWNK